MGLFSRIRKRMAYNRLAWLEHYLVEVHSSGFSLLEERPNGPPKVAAAEWSQVSRVVLLDGGLGSDQFFIYLAGQKDAICVPTEATGGSAFWGELTNRGLFPHEVSGLAVRSATPGALYEWPPSQSA